MPNPFDQFDSSPEVGNPFDSFDEKIDVSPLPLSPEAQLVMQRDPSSALAMGLPQIQAGGNDESFAGGMWEESNKPFVQIPRVEGATSTIGKTGQGLANAAIGMAEGLESPLGVATLGIGTLPKFLQRAAALGFGAMATKGASEAAGEATALEPSLNPFTWSPERTDVSKLAEAAGYAAPVPFLARPMVREGSNIALTRGDALEIGARNLEQATRGDAPLAISDPLAVRAQGIPVDFNPLNAPWIKPIAERGLKEAAGPNIEVPGQAPAVDLLRAERLRPVAENLFESEQARRAGIGATGDRVGGGSISFAGESAADAIPSARQAAVDPSVLQSGFEALGDRVVAGRGRARSPESIGQPPDLFDDIAAVVNSKDRLGIQERISEFQGDRSPVSGAAVENQAGDVTRIAKLRLEELKTGVPNPELDAIRRTLEPKPLAPKVEKPLPEIKVSPPNQKRISDGNIVGSDKAESIPNWENKPSAPIAKLESEINVAPGKFKAGNALTQEVGMQLRTVDDLARVQKLNESITEAMKAAKAKGDFMGAMEIALKRQILRETVETATNTGSWTEATGARKLGKRPLDPATSPEAAAWLAENAEKLGIKYEPASPAELPAPAPGTTRLYQGSGGSAGAGQGGAYWSAKPDYARSFGPKVEYIDVPTKDLAAFDVRNLEGSGTPDTYKLPPEISKGAKAHPEIPGKVFELDTPEGLLDRLDNKLAEVQNNIRNGKTFTGVTGLEPLMLDAAIVAARAAIKATKSVKAGIDAAVAYIKEKFPNAKFNPDELAEWVNKNASESVRSEGSSGGKVSATLDDVYKIFEPEPKQTDSIGKKISGAIEAVRTGLSSKFRPIDKLAEDIAKQYGLSRNRVAGVFEALKGSSGKGEADIYRFDRVVSDLVKGNEKDFNAYMFLRRGLDRLRTDAETGESRRSVGNYTTQSLQAKLDALTSKLGVGKIEKFQKAADNYQAAMDQALRLQVESGRMSPELYKAIKDGNQFYAPFKVMKYIEDSFKAEGSGAKIDTVADFAKKMEGIENSEFKLGDMLGAARHNILLSRILADKNLAMRKISDLAATDVDGVFIRKLAEGAEAPKGMDAVNVMEGGKVQKYAVDPSVAEAVQIFTGKGSDIVTQILAKAAIPFRAGATTFNLPFQISNLLADVPRSALVSKYGIRGMSDLVMFPLDLFHSLATSIQGNVRGKKNNLYLDFLDSGVAGSTVQEYLTPAGLRFQEPTNVSRSKKLAKSVLNSIPELAQAVEQTSKIMGVKRAMRFEGVESGAQLAKKIPEAITEIRRFSGSPDFGRQGRWVEGYRLNLLYMFLNARIQGTVADLGRLTGRDGAGTAAKTWGKVGTAVGIPTAYLYMLNNSDEYAADYAKRSDQEKANYWMIPKDSFITTESGEVIRDYWRIPKREVAKWISNIVESGLRFAEERDSEAFGRWAQQMAEDISPVNIQGDTFQERLESVGASMNPIIKAPLEAATGRDMYRHKSIVPDAQKKASPENQYTERTPSVFKSLADKMPDSAPEILRSPLMLENMSKNLTAGMLTQFIPKKPVEGRGPIENNPLMQRFQALPFTDSSEFDEKIAQYERESADTQLSRFRTAHDLMQANKGKGIREIAKDLVQKHGPDEKLMERVVDVWIADQSGINSQDRRILNLPVQQRAQFIANEFKSAAPELRADLIRGYAKKRILTESVAEELIKLLPEEK